MKHAALLLVVGLSFSNVFAAGETGTITISKAVNGNTYEIYRILDLESYNASSKAYSYKVNADWSDFFKKAEGETPAGAGLTYVNIDDQGYVTWKDGANEVEFSKAALKFAKDKTLKATDSKDATGETVTFTDLVLGYYLVNTSTGSLLNLTTTNPDAKIDEKNTPPTVDKKVQEDSKITEDDPNSGWDDKNDADLVDEVVYKTVITAYKGAVNYVLHDKMTGLDFKEVKSVQVDGKDLDPSNYTVTSKGLTDGCSFEIKFENSYLATITEATEIVVTYSGTLNSSATVAGDGNPNETWLDYGNNEKTEKDTTKTYIWKFDILKHNKEGEGLAGAKFTIINSAGENLQFEKVTENEKTFYKLTGKSKETAATEVESNTKGELFIVGLDGDVYTVTETAAPAGYNKLAKPFTVTITSSAVGEDTTKLTYTVSVPTEADDNFNSSATKGDGDTVKVLNTTGSQLPETGGMGTTYLYVIGGLLVAGSAVLMIAHKRMSAE